MRTQITHGSFTITHMAFGNGTYTVEVKQGSSTLMYQRFDIYGKQEAWAFYSAACLMTYPAEELADARSLLQGYYESNKRTVEAMAGGAW